MSKLSEGWRIFWLVVVIAAWLLAILTTGCATRPPLQGIPNFARVDQTTFRGGQPGSAGWRTLQQMGVREVIKLNEGRDTEAEALGMHVTYLPITAFQQSAFGPDSMTVRVAVELIKVCRAENIPIFVHCTHGEDRTSLIIAVDRVASQGWPKEAAYAEMRLFGFDNRTGLKQFWDEAVKETPSRKNK